MEIEQKVIIHFLCREATDANNIHTRLSAQFSDVTYSLRSVQRWYQYDRERQECWHGESWSGRPPIALFDIHILFALEKQPFTHGTHSLRP
jgi:hypothetical protein